MNEPSFLLVPSTTANYDQDQMQGLARGLAKLGCDVEVTPGPLSDSALDQVSSDLRPDVVLRANELAPPNQARSSEYRHVSWIQDPIFFYDARSPLFERHGDMVLFLGQALKDSVVHWPTTINTGIFLSGVDDSMRNWTPTSPAPASLTSLVGFCPSRLGFRFLSGRRRSLLGLLRPSSLEAFEELLTLVETYVRIQYEPCTGSLNETKVYSRLLSAHSGWAATHPTAARDLNRLLDRSWRRNMNFGAQHQVFDEHAPSPGVRSWLAWCTINVPRRLDRVTLAKAVLESGTQMDIYGRGWEHYSQFARASRGEITDRSHLWSVYASSKVNLCSNTHGLGLHSRTLEAMAVGGFVMMHEHPHANQQGSLENAFDSTSHFGTFRADTVANDIHAWLEDEPRRKRATEECRHLVFSAHTWTTRAQELLNTLTS